MKQYLNFKLMVVKLKNKRFIIIKDFATVLPIAQTNNLQNILGHLMDTYSMTIVLQLFNYIFILFIIK